MDAHEYQERCRQEEANDEWWAMFILRLAGGLLFAVLIFCVVLVIRSIS